MFLKVKDWWNDRLFNNTFSNRNSDSNVLKVLAAVLQTHAYVTDVDNQLIVIPTDDNEVLKVLESMKFHTDTIKFNSKNRRIPVLFKKTHAQHWYSIEHNIYIVILNRKYLASTITAKSIFNNLQLSSIEDYITIHNTLNEPNSSADRLNK